MASQSPHVRTMQQMDRLPHR